MSFTRLLVVCALCVAFALAQRVDPIDPTLPTLPLPYPGIEIIDTDLLCKADADCQIVKNTCSYDCGKAVNADGARRISGELTKICLDAGAASNTFCPDAYAACEKGVCVMKLVPGPVPVNQSLQICRADSDCKTFQPSCLGTPCCENTGVVGVSAANADLLQATWDRLCQNVPQPDCTTVRCVRPESKPTCVKGYCTINSGTACSEPVISLPPKPECDEKTRPNDFCSCVISRTEPFTSSWVCPPTCPGVPPKGCYCTAELSGSEVDLRPDTQLGYRCRPDACANASAPKDPSRCYCGVKAGVVSDALSASSELVLTAEWICKPDSCCPARFEKPATLNCPASELKVWCDEQKCEWQYACPRPPVCSCDNLPLPVLDPAVAGCETSAARWYCATSVGVIDGDVVAVNTSTSTTSPIRTRGGKKRQDVGISPILPCAEWDFTCNPIPECVANFDCGFNCYDASEPIPAIRCLVPDDPVAMCEQTCLKRFAKCAPLLQGSVRTCAPVKSADYELCVKKCQPRPPPVEDKCTYIRDKCNCEAAGCGWCEEELLVSEPIETAPNALPKPNVRVGYCASLNSKYQCSSPRQTFTTAEVDATGEVVRVPCNVILPIESPIILPVEPSVPEIDRCFLDERCVSAVDLNERIEETRDSDEDTVARDFSVFITVIIKSDSGLVNLGVDIHGEREPNTTEVEKICKILSESVSRQLKIDPKRVRKCKLAKVAQSGQKRDVESHSYVASMQLANDDGSSQTGSATTLAFSAVAALIAALALLF